MVKKAVFFDNGTKLAVGQPNSRQKTIQRSKKIKVDFLKPYNHPHDNKVIVTFLHYLVPSLDWSTFRNSFRSTCYSNLFSITYVEVKWNGLKAFTYFILVMRCHPHSNLVLQVQPCKLYNNKYMIALAQVTHTEIFALISVLVFKLLSRKVLFVNRKDNRNR